jgi:WD40 repeat protein
MQPLSILLSVALVSVVMADEPGPPLKLLGTLEGGRPHALANLAFSPDGKSLAVIDYNHEDGVSAVNVWDVDKRKVTAAVGGRTAHVASVAFSPDGKTLAASARDQGDEGLTVKLWDVATGKEKTSFTAHANQFCPVAFSPDGKTLASGGENAGKTSMVGGRADNLGVKLWDVATGKEKASLKGHAGPVFSVAFSPDGALVASGCGTFASNGQAGGGEVKLWDVATGKEKLTLKGRMAVVWSVAFSPDGKTLASGDVYGNVLLWDVQSGRQTLTLQAPKRRSEDLNSAYSVAFSPDGKTLVAATVQGIKLWEVKGGKPLGTHKGPEASVWSVAFSPDGKTLASAGSKQIIGLRDRLEDDPTLRLWAVVPSRKEDK